MLLWVLTACIAAFALQMLSAQSGRMKNVTIAWDHSWMTNEVPVGYIVYETIGTNLTQIGFTAHTNRQFTITNVPAGVHVYSVTATNRFWESEQSDTASTPEVSAQPTMLRIVVVLTNSP